MITLKIEDLQIGSRLKLKNGDAELIVDEINENLKKVLCIFPDGRKVWFRIESLEYIDSSRWSEEDDQKLINAWKAL